MMTQPGLPPEQKYTTYSDRIKQLESDLAAMRAERDALQESNRQESAAMALLLERAEKERDALLVAANEVCDANHFTEAQQAVRLLNTERWKVRDAIDAARKGKEGG